MKLRTVFNPLYPLYLLGMIFSTVGLFFLKLSIGREPLLRALCKFAKELSEEKDKKNV